MQWPWPRTESCWSGSVWLSIGSLQQHKLYSNTHKCLGHDSRGSAWLSIGSSLQPHELYSNTHKCLGHDSRGSVIAYFWHCMVTCERWEQRITKMGICTFLHYRVFALKACSLNASKKGKPLFGQKYRGSPKWQVFVWKTLIAIGRQEIRSACPPLQN